MPEIQGSKTQENLKEAFAGESQANRRYLYFAQKADVEGYPDVAALFRSVAEGETGHAFGHFDFLAEVGDPVTGEPVGATEDNLKSAIAGETYEYTEMYPGFARDRSRRGLRRDRRVARDAGPRREEPRRPLHRRASRTSPDSRARVPAGRSRRDPSAVQPPSSPLIAPPARPPEGSMTTTYDPFHPRYFDEADLRQEMTRVYDLCHGCRLCFKFCTAFPTLFEVDRPHDDQDVGQADGRRAGPGRRRVLPLQALLRQLPVHPRPARVGARLPAAHAARRAGRCTRPARSRCSDPADRPGARAAPTWSGKVNTTARPRWSTRSSTSPAARGRKLMEKVAGIASERVLPPYARQRFSTWLRKRLRRPAPTASPAAPGQRRPVPDVPRRVPGARRSARTWCRCTSATASSARCPTGQVCCGAPWLHSGDVDNFRKQGRKNVTVLADAIRDAQAEATTRSWSCPSPPAATCSRTTTTTTSAGPTRELVAEHTYDAAEYLMKVHKGEGTELDTDFAGEVPDDGHLPRALPPAGPEHRPQEP